MAMCQAGSVATAQLAAAHASPAAVALMTASSAPTPCHSVPPRYLLLGPCRRQLLSNVDSAAGCPHQQHRLPRKAVWPAVVVAVHLQAREGILPRQLRQPRARVVAVAHHHRIKELAGASGPTAAGCRLAVCRRLGGHSPPQPVWRCGAAAAAAAIAVGCCRCRRCCCVTKRHQLLHDGAEADMLQQLELLGKCLQVPLNLQGGSMPSSVRRSPVNRQATLQPQLNIGSTSFQADVLTFHLQAWCSSRTSACSQNWRGSLLPGHSVSNGNDWKPITSRGRLVRSCAYMLPAWEMVSLNAAVRSSA